MKGVIFFTSFALIIGLFFLHHPNLVEAKKRLPRPLVTSPKNSVPGNKPVISPHLRADRRALVVNFSNPNQASITYELEYTSEGIQQGVMGSVSPSEGQRVRREILFGTCSKNVCRYHRGIKNMKFVVTSTLNSGAKIRKTFKVKP